MLKHTELSPPGVILLEPEIFRDSRGHFLELWNKRAYEQAGISCDFVQDNVSRSVRGVLRGMHFQVGRPQAKLVTCLRGQIFDVAVDVRRGSPTFGRWASVLLSGDEPKALFVPEGFAHGFLAMSDWVDVSYKVTDFYSPKDERGVAWNDPQVGIAWPLGGTQPILYERDAAFPMLEKADVPEYALAV
jgi:dTDP-4-dehydrorhamnose 3,5-epimerase